MECLNINNQYISEPTSILKELNKYYKNLYCTRGTDINTPRFHQMLETSGLKVLTESQKLKCEGLVTERECKKALDTMINGKSPGCDGLTAEFYKKFWPLISDMLIESLNFAYEKGELSQSQKKGDYNSVTETREGSYAY